MSAVAEQVKQQAKNGKKRKRVKQSPEEMFQLECADRYRKLHHACTKQMHREAKVVKSFECQKIVRSIKAASASESARRAVDGDDQKQSKSQKRMQALQNKLDRTKSMDLDAVVKVGLKRLGVLSLDPSVQKGGGSAADANVSQNEDQFYQTLMESMLQHKRISSALDQLNEKVTEYRGWMTRRQAMLRGEDQDPDGRGSKKKKKNKNKQQSKAKLPSGNDTVVVAGGYDTRKRGLDLGGHEGASGLFIGSLSGMVAEEDGYGDGNEYYDEEDEDYGHREEKKKNRPGQRARKAKAMAIEARKAGKTWDSSVNWREKKERDSKNPDGQTSKADWQGRDKSKMANTNRDDGGAKSKETQDIHPSWAAAAAAKKSVSIAEFKGTKITFD